MAFDNKKINRTDYENDWALDIESNYIHIDNAKSGAKGYYCLGCGKEMQGVKRTNPNFQSYFRHHAKNIDQEKVECVVASRKYRERIAESILNRLKFVKVPTLYKYPPKGVEGIPMLLQNSKTITASYTKAQEWFYEDADGTIKWGKNPEVDERYLLIRPDVTLFDSKNNPILFVEFVITHKLDNEKLVKLSRIGIDTLQIIIPKVPEDQIEQVLKSSRKYKWEYNELEANTTYISIPQGNTEGISPIDEEQRRLFEESVSCRSAKINNLVRDINKRLRSESYKRTERLFEFELSRVAKNRARNQQRLGELEGKYRAEALGRNRELEEGIIKEQRDLEQNFRKLEKELIRDIKRAKQKQYEALNWVDYLLYKSNSNDFNNYKRCLKNPIIAPFMQPYENLTLSYSSKSIYEGQTIKESHIYLDSDNIYSIVINVYSSELRIEKPTLSGFKISKKKEQIKTIILLKKDNEVEAEIHWLKGQTPKLMDKNELTLF